MSVGGDTAAPRVYVNNILHVRVHMVNVFSPIDPAIGNEVSSTYSKAYLRHLTVSKEILAAQIASIHNLSFYLWLVGEARAHIQEGDFTNWKSMMVKKVSTRL